MNKLRLVSTRLQTKAGYTAQEMAKAAAKTYGITHENKITCDRLRLPDCDCSRLLKVDRRAIFYIRLQSQKPDTCHQIFNHLGMCHPGRGGGGIEVFIRTSFINETAPKLNNAY